MPWPAKALDRDRRRDESGHQTSVSAGFGAGPLNKGRQEKAVI